MRVYEAIALALRAEGCEVFFGVLGDGIMPIWAQLEQDPAISIYSARHEAAAVGMADGYSRTTGDVGVAMVTCGPGLTNAGTSLVAAVRNNTPLILLVGEFPETDKSKIQWIEQQAFVNACGAQFQNVASVDTLADDIADAFYKARVGQCPVVLNVPMVFLERSLDWDFDYRASVAFVPVQRDTPSTEILSDLADRLLAAERPVIIGGRGVRLAGAEDAVVELADGIGALLGTTLLAKGMFDGHPFDLGIAGAFSSRPTEELLFEADFVLGIGAELGYHTTEGGLLFPQAQIARIDHAEAPDALGVSPGLYIRGDAKKTMVALNQLLKQRGVRNAGYRTSKTEGVLAAAPQLPEPSSDGLDPRVLARHLSYALPENSAITCGCGHYWSFVVQHMAMSKGSEIHFTHQFGAIGQALPVAFGVSAGAPGRPHILIEGDGSILMALQELETVARYPVPLVVIVWNDSAYGAEIHKMRAHGFEQDSAKWNSPDFVAIARAMGGDGVCLKTEAEIESAVAAGLAAGGLYVIDARVSPTALSDPYGKLLFGIENQAPLLRPVHGKAA